MRIEPSDPDISTIYHRIKDGTYDLEPDFQRDIVWNTERQQKLVDSILRGWHIPPIHLVEIAGKGIFEVLDGKQRLTSIFNFIEGKFGFNSNFVPGIDEFSNLEGLKFNQFPVEIQEKFLQQPIRIFKVRDVLQNEAVELFLRLNTSVIVTASEKRNCIYGKVKDFLRREILDKYSLLFSEKTLGFSNLRMAYQDFLDKIFFLEVSGGLEIKPTSKNLEEMYFSNKIKPADADSLKINLELLQKTLEGFKYKLTKSTLITYYWFIRETKIKNQHLLEKVKLFLYSFESWRADQRNRYAHDLPIHNKYVEFENYLSVGWLDPISLQGRHKILISLFKEYCEHGRLGNKNEERRV